MEGKTVVEDETVDEDVEDGSGEEEEGVSVEDDVEDGPSVDDSVGGWVDESVVGVDVSVGPSVDDPTGGTVGGSVGGVAPQYSALNCPISISDRASSLSHPFPKSFLIPFMSTIVGWPFFENA